MKRGTEVGLGPDHIVLDEDPAPLKVHSPPFSAHVCCDQTAGWIKMPLGTKVGLGPGHIVLDRDPARPPSKGAHPLIFGPCLLWPNGRPSQLLQSTCYILIVYKHVIIVVVICLLEIKNKQKVK